jgi:hypothetical protein
MKGHRNPEPLISPKDFVLPFNLGEQKYYVLKVNGLLYLLKVLFLV